MSLLRILSLVTLIVVCGIVLWAFRGQREVEIPAILEEEVTDIQTDPGSGRVQEEQATDVRSIAQQFGQLYIQAVGTEGVKAATQAREFLTERGKTVMDTEENAAVGLRRFTLRLDAPQEISITEVVKKTESFAEATSSWRYADTTQTYYFYFMLENNRWRIDSIQSVQQ